MAWIRNGKVWKIVEAMSNENINRKIESHMERGWKMAGPIKQHGYGLGCLMYCERKGLHDSNKI